MSLKKRLNCDKEPVYLIDGTALLYRAFYARTDLSRSDGFPTNAINTVLRVLINLIRDEQPQYVAFLMDGKGRTFRNDLFDQYKANRPPMPEPLAEQIEPVKKGVGLLGIQMHIADGVEADDCICALANKYKKERPVIILASDKDLKQCLDENVFMVSQHGRKETIYTLDGFREKEGMEPATWPDFQAIIGDSTDNIPGIPKIGPVTARKLFAITGPTLEEVRTNYDQLPDKLREKVEPELENIFIYRQLTRMKTDCCDMDVDAFALRAMDTGKLNAFLDEYELRGLKRSVPKPAVDHRQEASAKARKKLPTSDGGMLSLFGEMPIMPKEPDNPLPVTEIATASDLPELSGKTVGLLFEDGAFFLGLKDTEYRYTGPVDELIRALKATSVIATPSIQELLRADDRWTAIPSSQWFDLSLAAYLLDPEARNYTWSRLQQSLYQDGRPEFVDIAAQLHPHARALAVLGYMQGIQGQIEGATLTTLMHDLEIPLIPALVSMEKIGIYIDQSAFKEFLDDVAEQLAALTRSIIRHAGHEFNIRSSQQLAVVLFDELKIKAGTKTATGQRSTANQVLEKIRDVHPIVEKILEYRMLEKLRSTYLHPLPKLADASSRIHTQFNQLATATGRLSSSKPNLQNIPIRGKYGPRMRACFTAAKGNLLAAADYSQIELRVLAHFSKDPALLDAFRNDEDIHTRTAALLTDKTPDEVLPDERRNAKTINFGLIYGMGVQKLARELKIKQAEAKEFTERYFEKLATLKAYYDTIIQDAQADGFVTTLAGRRRLLPELHSRNNMLASEARRQAINTVIQGTAADIIKMAMLTAHNDEELKQLNARLILQVHDELIIEAPANNIEAAAKRLVNIMQNAATLDIPLKVDMGIGKDWATAH